MIWICPYQSVCISDGNSAARSDPMKLRLVLAGVMLAGLAI
jgi:hypothetical protein